MNFFTTNGDGFINLLIAKELQKSGKEKEKRMHDIGIARPILYIAE